MMTNEKLTLIQQMEEQRFKPVTQETLSLYHAYGAIIDQHNPDDLSHLFFYQGEYFFRIGDLNQSLSFLARCLQAPKSPSLRHLDALSYNIIGLIYSYLGQETIAIDYLIQAKNISLELNLPRECAVCYANLGLIYGQLEAYENALAHFEQALSYTSKETNQAYNIAVLCHAYCGILHCKQHNYDKALDSAKQIELLLQENSTLFYDASVLNLYIRLYDVNQDNVFLKEHLNKLTTLVSSCMDFLEQSEFYFDIVGYLIQQKKQEECSRVLDYIQPFCMKSPLIFLRYTFLKYQVAYHQIFGSDATYLECCSQLIALLPRYQEEQNQTKLYSLEYVERLRQAKDDSELYRERSRTDQMTGLLNKYTIQFLVEDDLSRCSPSRQSAMILIDLDHFKQINDTLGHLVGDSFICQTASIIQNYFKDKALCGRVGGDEFLVYINNVPDRSFVTLQTEILRQEIHRQTSERNITITTQASIGIAFSSDDCYSYETLFSAADKALYRAKLEGRNKVVVAE